MEGDLARMAEYELKHKRIHTLQINETSSGKTLYVEFALLDRYIENLTDYELCLFERDSEHYLTIETKEVSTEESFTILSGQLVLDGYLDSFKAHTFWDLYLRIHKEEHEDPKLVRIKANNEDIRLHSFFVSDYMFIPYRTKKGNVSFKIAAPEIFGRMEHVDLKENGELTFSGYSVVPPGIATANKTLVISSTETEEEVIIPLPSEDREDLRELFQNTALSFTESGFHGSVDLKELFQNGTNTYFKFFVEYTNVINGEEVKIRSHRLPFFPRNPETEFQSVFIQSNGRKLLARVKPTKKSRFLSIRVFQYNALKETVRKAKNFLVRVKRGRTVKRAYKLSFTFLGKLPAKKKQVVFESFLGKQFSCNPRAIYEYMLENHPEYEMYWSIDPRSAAVFEGKGLKTINRFSIPWLFKMARSKYWVSNSRLPIWIPKPSHTTYLQTWHGTPLKRLAADMDEVHMPGTNTAKYKKNFLLESSRWDYLISPNRYSSEIFARAFGFEKDMIESGYPRNDFLHNANNAETMNSLKERLELPLDKKVILYAPTWRDNEFYAKGKYKFNLKLELDKMQEELGDEYIVLLRMHYLIAENLDITPFAGFAYDVSHHTDISELYLISDLLITDYSSVFFDYANLGRPMIFYVYDIENYRDTLRGFYFDFEAQAPGPLVKTTEDVIRHIQHPDPASQANFDAFYQKFCYLEDGEASKRVVEKVFKTK